MGITEEQRRARQGWLGSSDMAMVLGVSPYGNAYDCWMDKTGKLGPDPANKPWLDMGNKLEAGILSWAEGDLGPIKCEQEDGSALFRKAQGFPIGSHADGEVIASGVPVEAKTAGILGPFVEYYGEPGSDELPDRILVQGHVHMLCWDREVCWVPVLLGGKGFVMYHVSRKQEMIDIICDTAMDFWETYVEKDMPPPDIIPSFAMAKRRKREPGKIIKLGKDEMTLFMVLVTAWENAREGAKLTKDILEGAYTEVTTYMGDAEGVYLEDGRIVTYLEHTKETISGSDLKEKEPEIFEKYKNVSKSRVLRIKKPPKKKF